MTAWFASVDLEVELTVCVLRVTCLSGSNDSPGFVDLVEVHPHRRLGADATRSEGFLQHFLDRPGQAHFGRAPDVLGGRGLGQLAYRLPGAGQQAAA